MSMPGGLIPVKKHIHFLKRYCWKNSCISKIIVNRQQQVPKVTASELCDAVPRTVARRWKIQNYESITLILIHKAIIFVSFDISNSNTVYRIFGSTLG